MGKKGSPAEWTDPGQLTEEQIKKIMEPIGDALAPAIEVEPEPEIFVEPDPEIVIEGEVAPDEEPPIVVDIEEEPQTVSPQPGQAEASPGHDQMVKAVIQLLRGLYRARHNGQEPDAKYVDRMRDMYVNQSDEHLRQAVEALTKEAGSIEKVA